MTTTNDRPPEEFPDEYPDTPGNTLTEPQAPGQAPPLQAPKRRMGGGSDTDWGKAVTEPLVVVGDMIKLLGTVFAMIARKPWGFWGEARDQAYDAIKLAWIPMTLAVFGWGFGAPGLSGGAILYTFGVPDRLGAFFNMALLREGSPFILGMVIAGIVGAAITADLGARKVREEIDAMQVLGVDPVRTLVVPRVVACTLATSLLSVAAIVVGLVSGWFAAGPVFGATLPGYIGSIFDVMTTVELLAAVVKCTLFGLVIAVICCYMGLNAKGGSIGVGRAVNYAVVISFAGVWIVNFTYTMMVLGLFPDLHTYK